jgi:hypothetical protein
LTFLLLFSAKVIEEHLFSFNVKIFLEIFLDKISKQETQDFCHFFFLFQTIIFPKNTTYRLVCLFEGSSNGLGGFGDGVLGEVSGEGEADGGLDLGGLDGGLLVGASDSGGLGGDLVEHVKDEGVQDLDALGGESEALLGVLVDAVDVGVEARAVSTTARTSLLGSRLSSLGHFLDGIRSFLKGLKTL